MRTIKLGKSRIDVPVVIAGCMRMTELERKEAAARCAISV